MLETLLDTGSEMSLIKESVVQQLNLKVITGKDIPQLQGITGKKLRILGKTTTSIIVGDNQPLEVPLAIVPDHYLEPAMLLGMNALGRVTLTLDHRNKKQFWNNVTYPLKYHEHCYGKVTHIKIRSTANNKSFPAKAYVRLRKKIKLPPFCAAMKEIAVDEAPGTTLVVDPEHKNVQTGLPLVTEVTEEKTIFLPMINNSKIHLTLHQGVFLARYEIINSNLEKFPEEKCLKTTISESMGPENDAVPGKTSRIDKLNTILSPTPCQQLKTARGLQMLWQELPTCHKPLERVSMDITDMHTSHSGHRYVLTLIDHYSRYVKFVKMRSRAAEEIV